VNRGAVTIEDGCGGSETYGPGQAFEQIGGRIHRAVNYSADTVESSIAGAQVQVSAGWRSAG
jgi:hypothetical protein